MAKQHSQLACAIPRVRHSAKNSAFSKAYLFSVGVILTCISLLIASTFASASTPARKKLSPLQQGLAFYKGKTITFIVPSAAGSTYDVLFRAIATEMANYLQASIDVEDISSGQAVPGQNLLAHSIPNGLTIGFYNIGSDYYDLLTDTAGLNFNLEREIFIGGSPNVASVVVTQSTTPYTSFASLIHGTTASNPAKVLVTSGAEATSTALLFDTFGIHAQLISGYANSSALIAGFLRGDGNLTLEGSSEFETEIQAGTVRVLAVDSPTNKIPSAMADHTLFESSPTVPALIKKYPPKTNIEKSAYKYLEIYLKLPDSVIGAPSKTPTNEVAALSAAAKSSMDTSYVKSVIAELGHSSVYLTGASIKAIYVKAYAEVSKMSAFIQNIG